MRGGSGSKNSLGAHSCVATSSFIWLAFISIVRKGAINSTADIIRQPISFG
ncbi:hypothetical protein CES85_3782 (plasmid) [Ochrobactrum quorumnocens]|uniref:Uncharacterized protein n=1 Tax=Ochrobactrum quorumnocens TaxID=271865 RepID=A0A248UN26_9HYPH|nr:hypothetical protein CES85_3782 [[Ochrobactrum] quorumnocens]